MVAGAAVAARCSAPLSHLLLLVSPSAPGAHVYHPHRLASHPRCLHMSSTTTPISIPPIRVQGAGSAEVNGLYAPQDPQRVPIGFQRTCEKMRWPPQATVRAYVFVVL